MSLDHQRGDDGTPHEGLEERLRAIIERDIHLLNSLGYTQELRRRMSGFSNFALSFSIICIAAGGITSFPQGYCSVGGASIGLGWPLCCLMSLCVAATMAQIASAFPTAGGLYHWAAILGGRGWGWLTAWTNLAGLIMILAAVNVGAYQFTLRALASAWGLDPRALGAGGEVALQLAGVLAITCTQAALNHRGIRITSLLTDISGYWIMLVAIVLTVGMLVYAPSFEPARLVTFDNLSGSAGGDVWPETASLGWLYCLGFLLPAYTVTGFDASANTSEETVGASHHVPRAIVRSVVASGVAGWVMLSAIVLAAPDPALAAAHGNDAFFTIFHAVLPGVLQLGLFVGIAIAQFFCGLATVTSASRMAYAFARDGGLPYAAHMRRVSAKYRTPAVAIWSVALLCVAFVVHTPVYSTIAAAGTIFLYVSYVLPTTLGLFAYGRRWSRMGPWDMGATAYRTLAVLSIAGCGMILMIGIQPPNDKNLWIVLAALAVTAIVWFGYERHRFRGPPLDVLHRSLSVVSHAAEQPADQSPATAEPPA